MMKNFVIIFMFFVIIFLFITIISGRMCSCSSVKCPKCTENNITRFYFA